LRARHGLVQLQVAIEGGVVRVADVVGEEDVLDGQPAPRTQRLHHGFQGPPRVSQVREQVAGVREVVGRHLLQLLGGQVAEGHGQVQVFGFSSGQPQDRPVKVDTHQVPLRPDEVGHPQRRVAPAAAQVKDAHSGPQAG
jgi:hypothetical protein